jgi:hypothetical protein
VTTATLPTFSAASVRERARDLLRALLTALALLPYLVGVVAGAVVAVGVWVWAAVLVGWRDGRNSIPKEHP